MTCARTSPYRVAPRSRISGCATCPARASAQGHDAIRIGGFARGPGLGFTRLVAPFTLTSSTLELADARAFSPSLGLTARGRINLGQDRADIQGTIVPAYFFNSLLGGIPLVGRLFSPEKGGGVFAANYSVHGPLSDPQVSGQSAFGADARVLARRLWHCFEGGHHGRRRKFRRSCSIRSAPPSIGAAV